MFYTPTVIDLRLAVGKVVNAPYYSKVAAMVIGVVNGLAVV